MAKKTDINVMKMKDFDEESFLNAMGFSEFGKIRNPTKRYHKVLEETKLKNIIEVPKINEPQSDSSGESSDDEPHDDKIEYTKPIERVPMSNLITFDHGKKIISGITINASGSRMLVGGHDFNVKMYDFATMDSSFRGYRTIRPLEDVPVRGVKHSPAGDLIMVYGGSNLIKLMDRDGKTICDCIRGDRYIADKGQTAGHVSEVNSASWNPIDLDNFITCGMDQTIRIWNVECVDIGCRRVMKLRDPKRKHNPCVELLYDHMGITIIGALLDGSICIWDPKRSTSTPVSMAANAHQNGGAAYSIAASRNKTNLVSRGLDDTLKLWDIRNLKQNVKAINLPNCFNNTRVIYSPDYRMVITGTSENRGTDNCALNFYNADDLDLLISIPFEGSSPTIPFWHPKLNQLFVGCADGKMKVFFDPKRSMNGILLCMTKIHNKKYDEGEDLLTEQVFTPYSKEDGLDMTNVNVRKLQIRARRDPFQTRKPEPPVYGPGQGGRLTTAMSLSAFVCKQLLPTMPPDVEKNPRDAILRYAKLAEEEPYFVAPAYEKTQPKPIYREESSDEDDDILKKKKTT